MSDEERDAGRSTEARGARVEISGGPNEQRHAARRGTHRGGERVHLRRRRRHRHRVSPDEVRADVPRLPGEKGKTRVENLEELVTATTNFEQSIKEDKPNKEIAEQYLDMISLDSGDRQASEHDDAAQLMTLHSAKGLEFKLVLMTGLEESLFPHGRSMENPSQLQEERRLCYVGITRAMEKLYITHAESRRLHGSDTFNPPSRFLREIPKDLINEIRPRAQTNVPYNRKDFKETKFEFEDEIGIALGQRVMHKKFGEGVVLNYEGSGDAARVQINFNHAGTKWLVMAYANLEKL